ncbi:MAG: DUF4287 domain-containing protein [Acidobacteriota bacterium]
MASPEEMAQKMLANLKEKTGKTAAQWQKVLDKESFEKHGEIVKFLKSEHGVTHGFANLIAHESRKSASIHADSPDDLVANQYAKKPDLLPIYEKLTAAVQKFGKDVEISPKKTTVSLRRKKQFGVVKPATKTRMDVGIQLKGDPADGRLEACKAGGMTSHQVSVTSVAEVDKELIAWLKEAYSRAG